MLNLTRRPGESLIVSQGGQILAQIKVNAIERDRDQVKLAIDAPLQIQIDRLEIYASKLKSAQLAAEQAGSVPVDPCPATR